MKNEDAWNEWMNRNREHPPPSGLAERILIAVELSPALTINDAAIDRQPRTLVQQIVPYLLLSAALVLCAARLYTTVGLLVPEFAFAAQPASPQQGSSHDELVAAGS
ncbi:MAG: hypothetical protein Q8K78_11880 [Planctomycetaceae bacterium]|nr:hypothetical protein [Planctomycetaceae bacterium]